MVEDSKYVVFKADEFRKAIADLRSEVGWPERAQMLNAEVVPDAVVIRLQDLFAAGVLFTYAGAVQSAIEIMAAHNIAPPADLLKTRDHFFELASSAEASPIKKLPDHD